MVNLFAQSEDHFSDVKLIDIMVNYLVSSLVLQVT